MGIGVGLSSPIRYDWQKYLRDFPQKLRVLGKKEKGVKQSYIFVQIDQVSLFCLGRDD